MAHVTAVALRGSPQARLAPQGDGSLSLYLFGNRSNEGRPSAIMWNGCLSTV
jgi:hypothetical protein